MHASLSDIVADVSANSIEAGAALVEVSVSEKNGLIELKVVDNGKGMPPEIVARAFDPFYTEPGKHAARKVGMGLPFVKQTCDACGGTVDLRSEQGRGTTLVCTFRADNIDLPPMGDVAEAVLSLFNFDGDFDLVFTHVKEAASYSISRRELQEAVGGFDSVEGLSLAKDFLRGQEEELA
ncbi:MAG: sensor histidine kinase [Kiritimatiellae bacterium]|nr:sensor histidine kinase [Kiritimatiellia bacterium]